MIQWAGVAQNIEVTPSDAWLKYVLEDPEFESFPLLSKKELKRAKNKLVNENLWDDDFGDSRQEIIFIGDKSEMDQKLILKFVLIK